MAPALVHKAARVSDGLAHSLFFSLRLEQQDNYRKFMLPGQTFTCCTTSTPNRLQRPDPICSVLPTLPLPPRVVFPHLMCAPLQSKLVLPKSLLEAGLPHLMRLSVSYLDASCEDLSDVTWEQLARKLGLKAEVRGSAVHVWVRKPWPCETACCLTSLSMATGTAMQLCHRGTVHPWALRSMLSAVLHVSCTCCKPRGQVCLPPCASD
jgi:hypothetical protein